MHDHLTGLPQATARVIDRHARRGPTFDEALDAVVRTAGACAGGRLPVESNSSVRRSM
jgi:hypothetical protein